MLPSFRRADDRLGTCETRGQTACCLPEKNPRTSPLEWQVSARGANTRMSDCIYGVDMV